MKRRKYQAPTTTVVELRFEGVMCSSNSSAVLQNYNWDTIEEE